MTPQTNSGDSSPTIGSAKPSKTANLLRTRENQRRSRARRREYIQELEDKYRNCEAAGAEASVEIQRAARKVLEENKKLRRMLTEMGVRVEDIDDEARNAGQLPPTEQLQSMLYGKQKCGSAEPAEASSAGATPGPSRPRIITRPVRQDSYDSLDALTAIDDVDETAAAAGLPASDVGMGYLLASPDDLLEQMYGIPSASSSHSYTQAGLQQQQGGYLGAQQSPMQADVGQDLNLQLYWPQTPHQTPQQTPPPGQMQQPQFYQQYPQQQQQQQQHPLQQAHQQYQSGGPMQPGSTPTMMSPGQQGYQGYPQPGYRRYNQP